MNWTMNRHGTCMHSYASTDGMKTHIHKHTHSRQHTLLGGDLCQVSPAACRLCVWHRGYGLEPHTSCALCLGFYTLWMDFMNGRDSKLSQHQGPHSTRSDIEFWTQTETLFSQWNQDAFLTRSDSSGPLKWGFIEMGDKHLICLLL